MQETAGTGASQGHYTGLLVEWYDDFLAGEGDDILLYSALVLEEEGPVLELACGTGRLMLPLLREGQVVDGLDISEDMLARARAKIENDGFTSRLFAQSMEHFDCGRRYHTIFVSGGSFQLIATLDGARRALGAIHRHLEEGGRFILDLVVGAAPFGGSEPKAWKTGRIATRGNERLVYSSRSESDAFTQQSHLQTRYELFRNNELIETVKGELILREYSRSEAELLLRDAGFVVEKVEQRRIMSTHSVSVLFICRKPESLFTNSDLES